MNHWRCLNPSCPRREPIVAEIPPACYTCAKPMAAMDTHPVLTDEQEAEYLTNVCGWQRSAPEPINHINSDFARPVPIQSLFIGLHARIPGEREANLGDEVCYPGYRRMRVDRGADGQWPEQVQLRFAEGTSDTAVEAWFFGISHGESGEPMYFDEICPRVRITNGATPILTLPMRAIAALGAYLAQ